jgi:DNA-binding transcriptional MerR regulator
MKKDLQGSRSLPVKSQENKEKTQFTISDLADEFDVSTRSIRFYEEKNLISPARTAGNQRTYSRRDRARLKLILRGKRFGYSLEEIAEIIGMTNIDFDEKEQLSKAVVYGKKRILEVRDRINELKLLEQELIVFQQKIEKAFNAFNDE